MVNFYCDTWHDVTPSKIDDEDLICHFKTYFFKKNYIATWNFVMGYNTITNNGEQLQFYTNGQWMRVYMLTIYIINVECDDIMLGHHLQLDVACHFTYTTNGILVVHVGCNLFLVTNYNRKLRLFF